MDYEVSLSAEEVKSYPTPFKALEALKNNLKALIEENGQNPKHYITQSTNIGKGLKMTATYSEERKQHFDAQEGE